MLLLFSWGDGGSLRRRAARSDRGTMALALMLPVHLHARCPRGRSWRSAPSYIGTIYGGRRLHANLINTPHAVSIAMTSRGHPPRWGPPKQRRASRRSASRRSPLSSGLVGVAFLLPRHRHWQNPIRLALRRCLDRCPRPDTNRHPRLRVGLKRTPRRRDRAPIETIGITPIQAERSRITMGWPPLQGAYRSSWR